MIDSDIPKSSTESTPLFDPRTSYLNFAARFIQRTPSHGVKEDGQWRTVRSPVIDQIIIDHVEGITTIGTLAQWYPSYAILDVDGHIRPRSFFEVEAIRDVFGINSDLSSITYETSPGSYHVLWKPLYGGKPATVSLVHEVLGPIAKGLGVELYPQASRVVRAPFHPSCSIVHRSCNLPELDTLEKKLEAFDNLAFRDLRAISATHRKARREKGLIAGNLLPLPTKGIMREGADLYGHGLQQSSSRYEAQHKVALYLWRLNLTPEQALDELFRWVCDMNNGYSRDADAVNRGDWRVTQQIRREHECLVSHIWNEFERQSVYPASAHNTYFGHLAKMDLVTAVKHCGGNIPKFKFLSQMFGYFNAFRKMRLNVHSDKLTEWSGKNSYKKHLLCFEESGLLCREPHYLAGEFSKVIQLNVRPSFSDFNDAATFTDGFGQALTFDESLEELGRKEVYAMLTENGVARSSAYHFVENRCLVD